MGDAPPHDDRLSNGAANLLFGTGLGVASVALPLVALAAGYDAVAIGLLTAASAITQLGIRLVLPGLLRRFPDRTLIAFSGAVLSGSYIALVFSTAAPVFLLAQGLQGLARGLFWIASQTHAVRGSGGSVHRLAQIQLMGNVGTLAGPALAGALAAIDPPLALIAGALAGGAVAVVGLALHRLPAFQRREGAGRGEMWRNTDVVAGGLANVTAGGWRSLLNSYIPVILAGAGHGAALIGILVTLADAAATAASAILVPLRTARPAWLLRFGIGAMGVVVSIIPFVAGDPLLAAAVLLIGGAGSGLVVVLAPALVSDAVEPDARGDALALAGAFRAVALLIPPAGVALALSVVPLSLAMVGAGAAIAAPSLAITAFIRRRRDGLR